MGFYPVCPATDQYVIGSPLFKKMILHFENGKTFSIQAQGNNAANVYIGSALFNNKAYAKNWLSHFDMLKGGSLVLKMSNQPALKRGINVTDAPYSFSAEKQK
jgi:putative alpha-1,2-mannosidase